MCWKTHTGSLMKKTHKKMLFIFFLISMCPFHCSHKKSKEDIRLCKNVIDTTFFDHSFWNYLQWGFLLALHFTIWVCLGGSPEMGTVLNTGNPRKSFWLIAGREFELFLFLLRCEGPAILVGAAEVCDEFILTPASSPAWSCAAREEIQTQTVTHKHTSAAVPWEILGREGCCTGLTPEAINLRYHEQAGAVVAPILLPSLYFPMDGSTWGWSNCSALHAVWSTVSKGTLVEKSCGSFGMDRKKGQDENFHNKNNHVHYRV